MKFFFKVLAGVLFSLPLWAEDMRTFEDFHGEVMIPSNPQRIVSLQDHVVTMSLVEMGAPVVGSVGRVDDDGKPYLRGVKDLLGVDFDNSPIEFLGWTDIEKVVAVQPDLIITTHYAEEAELQQLRAIAPTVAINQDQPLLDFMRDVADAGGVLDTYNTRLARYNARLKEAKAIIPNAEDIRVSIVLSNNGILRSWEQYGALTQVIDDIGFARPEAVKGLGHAAEFSPEAMPGLDADFIIDTYRVSEGDTPAMARERMAEVLPQWCSVWHACRHNQYLIFPRTFVYSSSFASLELNIQLLTTHIGGREFVPFTPANE